MKTFVLILRSGMTGLSRCENIPTSNITKDKIVLSSNKSAIYVVAHVSHLLQGSLIHHAYLYTRDLTIPRHTPTGEPTVRTAEQLDVGLDGGKGK